MATKFRTEKDSLGEFRVPAAAYYGVQTARAVENYPISGLRANPRLIHAFGMVKVAAALANLELRLLDPRRARAIIQAGREVIEGRLDEHFVVDVFQAGAGVSLHMNANEVIANRAIEILRGKRGDYSVVNPNDHVNYGQSTNDVFPTSMRLATLLELGPLDRALANLEKALAAKGREFQRVVKSGRTHMMDAVPIRLGQEFAAYAVAAGQARQALARAAGSLREIGLGGSAVGTGLNTHPRYRKLAVRYLSEISRERLRPAADLRAAMQSNLAMAEVSAALRNLALELIRISNDLRLMSSGPNTGFYEIVLPALQPGSSIMPGKVNPVMPEMLTMVSFQAVGNDTATALAVQAGQLELNVMMPAMAFNTLFSAHILHNAVTVFTEKCVDGITANEERCHHYAHSTVSLATALNPYIGYAKAAEVVKESMRTGKTLRDIVLEHKLLTEDQAAQILDPARMTEPAAPLRRKGQRQK